MPRIVLPRKVLSGRRGDGAGKGIEFWGTSFVCDPFGAVIAEASEGEEENILVEIDLKRVEEIRQHWPFLRDRRIDAYDGLTKRFIDEVGD